MADNDDGQEAPKATVYAPSSIPGPPQRTVIAAAGPGPRLSPGATLNDIYRVVRFIARGGMGEVYEGVNVNTEERVAIKVVLGHLAEDEHVQGMFLREARTLTRLNHPALVLYRVLAREPSLGLVYIVTEYVDGVSLDKLVGQRIPDERELKALMRRLAEGLKAAHDLGAIHRDISPDNVLVPGGQLEAAKIIDFGIAKDLVGSQGTIVGDGFAGKLGYVAPEQFGDFGREIGPWTDVYSLGLVMLALQGGKPVDMGATLVEAVDRRRAGPDLSGVPESLRRVFTGMLTADPKQRFRSMDAVLEALGNPTIPPPPPPEDTRRKKKGGSGVVAAAVMGGLAVAAVGAAGVGWLILNPDQSVIPLPKKPPAPPAQLPLAVAVERAVGSAHCAWLEYGPLATDGEGKVALTLTGAAGDPDSAAGRVKRMVERAGHPVALDPSGVRGLTGEACDTVNALRATRAPASGGDLWMTAPEGRLLPAAHAECRNNADYALAVIEGRLGEPGQDASLLLLFPDGEMRRVFGGEAGLKSLSGRSSFVGAATQTDPNHFRASLCLDDPGVYGVALVRGRGVVDQGLAQIDSPGDQEMPDDIAQRFASAAAAGGWKTQMAWFKVEPGDEAPVSPPPPATLPPPPPPVQASPPPPPPHVRPPVRPPIVAVPRHPVPPVRIPPRPVVTRPASPPPPPPVVHASPPPPPPPVVHASPPPPPPPPPPVHRPRDFTPGGEVNKSTPNPFQH